MSKDSEIVINWRRGIEGNQDRITPVGRLDVGVEDGNFQTVFEGGKLIVDATGTDGGATLVTPDGRGLLKLEDMFPAEVQAQIDEEGRLTKPQYLARIKKMSIEFDLIPAQEEDLSRLREEF